MDARFNTDIEFYSFVQIIQVLYLPFFLEEMKEDIECYNYYCRNKKIQQMYLQELFCVQFRYRIVEYFY